MIHHRRRVDENQKVIVKYLRELGMCVIDLSASGGGVMDLLLCYRGKTWMVEIKNPDKPKADQSLTPAQIRVHKEIADVGCEVHVIRTVDEALALVTT
jgi:Holliday junction resolvase